MTIKDQISDWLTGLVNDLVSNYTRLGLKASGNWEKELESEVEEKAQGFRFKILGANYTYWLEHGRGPNVNQSKEALRRFVGWAGSTFLKDWVKHKKLDINPYSVAYKIAKHGIKVPNRFNPGKLISNVITDNRINELIKQVSYIFSMNIIEDIRKKVNPRAPDSFS